MAYLLQVDFPFEGPFSEKMSTTFLEIAESINKEKGFQWKIWTESKETKETKEAGGIYVFEEKKDAENYAEMHEKRLKSFGVKDIRVKIFDINEKLTKLNHGMIK
ncbi:monooxygenase [Priestia aryabhattai]|uniref:monooxygenase n=1 Tax=Priestia aryabhattai TaxID=412384 RepID=UPI0024532FC7|nr:monooxygenase [Priestia aryabhattai]MDH3111277.1 monooxygenase [Priestia aryabhattai]MDH3130006.1 monooxygenase [Priestia aryabhattai]